MPWKLSEKNQQVARLQRLLQAGQKLELALRIKHPGEDADRVWESNQRLATEIDALIGRVLDDWATTAKKATADLASAKKEFDAAAADIAKKVRLAQSIIKASSALDDAVVIAKRILGA